MQTKFLILIALALCLMVGVILGLAQYLGQEVRERSEYGARRKRSLLACIATVMVVGVIEALVLPARLWRGARNVMRPRVALANIAEGTRGSLTKFSDGVIGSRFLLVKAGSDSDHIALSGAGDTPYGVCTDEASAAEEEVNVNPLACVHQTQKATNDATGAIAFGDLLVPAASGKVKKIAAGAGNYYVVGMAIQPAAADGDIFEIIPIGSWKTQ
jgi:hypothetical protein